MAESSIHRKLIECLHEVIFSSIVNNKKVFSYVTSREEYKSNNTPKIISSSGTYYYPDLFISSLDNEFIIIGEAKLAKDIEMIHSINQYFAYVEYANRFSKKVYICFSTQYGFKPRMMSIVRNKLLAMSNSNIEFIVHEF